jgi:hypothetical protein
VVIIPDAASLPHLSKIAEKILAEIGKDVEFTTNQNIPTIIPVSG